MKKYEFNDNEIEYIVNTLSKQPYIEVFNLLNNITYQFNNQVNNKVEKEDNK